eukprot:403369799
MPRFDVTYNFKFSEEQFRNLPVWEEIGNQEDDKTVKIRISYSCRKCEIAWITKISTRKLNWGFCNECGVDDAHFNVSFNFENCSQCNNRDGFVKYQIYQIRRVARIFGLEIDKSIDAENYKWLPQVNFWQIFKESLSFMMTLVTALMRVMMIHIGIFKEILSDDCQLI